MNPTRARLTTTTALAAALAAVVTAAVLVTAALMMGLRPHDPQFVAVGTPEAPAEFGEQFRINGQRGGVAVGLAAANRRAKELGVELAGS